jgi:hypothetical protein
LLTVIALDSSFAAPQNSCSCKSKGFSPFAGAAVLHPLRPADALQLQVGIGVGPAGDVWVINNWQDTAACYGKPEEGISTRCGGQGVVVFFGMAKPVRTPLIGPARPY